MKLDYPMQLSALLQLLWVTAVLFKSCRSASSSVLKFYKTTGADCLSSDFTRTVPGLCSRLQCSAQCAKLPNCQAFRLMTNGACQCKLFLFDACSHRVQSVPNCTHQVTVYVRALTGVPPGRLCPPGYQHTRYGTSYKVVTAPTLNWTDANQICSAEPGLSKFADAIDLDEAEYLRSLKELTGSSYCYHIGGFGYSNSYSDWYWAACNLPIDPSVWHSGEPNLVETRECADLHKALSSGGIDDYPCDKSQLYICECQSVF